MKNIETNKYFAIMSEKDDVELMRIITVERADYQADAVIAAEEELKDGKFLHLCIRTLQKK